MKKSLFLFVLFLVTIFPLVAQEEESEELPVEYLTLKKGNIPPAVIKAAEELFKGDTQISYGVFPYQLKDYGWVKDENYNEPIDHYEIHLHTSNGAEVYAVFESTGELIRYRQSLKNASVPVAINNAIAKTEYKDWKLIEDTEVIKSSQKKVTDHYSLNFVKGNDKKTLYFNADGTLLNNKR